MEIHMPRRHNATPFSEPTTKLLTAATAALHRDVAAAGAQAPTAVSGNGSKSTRGVAQPVVHPPLLYPACRHTPQCIHPLSGLDGYRWPELRQAAHHQQL